MDPNNGMLKDSDWAKGDELRALHLGRLLMAGMKKEATKLTHQMLQEPKP